MNDDVDNLIQQAVAALKVGRKLEARVFLDRVIELDERNEQAWLWMSGVVETDEEQLICLENVLTINPDNQRAAKGLAVLNQKMASAPSPYIDSTPEPVSSTDWWTEPVPSTPNADIFPANNPFGDMTAPVSPTNEEEEWSWEGTEASGTNPSPFDSGFFRRPSPYLPSSSPEISQPESDPFGLKRRPTSSTSSTNPVRQEPRSAPVQQRATVSFPETPISEPTPPMSAMSLANRSEVKSVDPMFDWNALDQADLAPSQTALFTTMASKANSTTMSPALRIASIPEELRRSVIDPVLVVTVVILAVLSIVSISWLIHTLTTH